jgi:hypothetical protein
MLHSIYCKIANQDQQYREITDANYDSYQLNIKLIKVTTYFDSMKLFYYAERVDKNAQHNDHSKV